MRAVLALALIATMPALAGPETSFADDMPRPVILPTTNNLYFLADIILGADYLLICTDGTYRVTDVQHVERSVSDCGTWSSDTNGVFRMVSTRREPEFHQSDLELHWDAVYHPDLVLKTRDELAALLASSTNMQFDPVAVRGSHLRLAHDEYTSDFLRIESWVKEVDRKTIEQFVGSLSSWLETRETNVFWLRPYRYRDITFLEDRLGLISIPVTVEQSVDNILRFSNSCPAWTVVRIGCADYEHGANRNYPFIFYPQLTLLYSLPRWAQMAVIACVWLGLVGLPIATVLILVCVRPRAQCPSCGGVLTTWSVTIFSRVRCRRCRTKFRLKCAHPWRMRLVRDGLDFPLLAVLAAVLLYAPFDVMVNLVPFIVGVILGCVIELRLLAHWVYRRLGTSVWLVPMNKAVDGQEQSREKIS